jgi:chloramphenicol-sensitive protein RarD
LVLGVGAYLLWGVLPLYLVLLQPAGPVEVIIHRILWSLLFCAVLLVFTRQVDATWGVLRRPATLGVLGLAGVLLTINWLVFVWAALTDHLVDAALGYFINPLVSVLLGVVLLGERLRPVQWVALGIASSAVVAIGFTTGAFPWVALTLAFSFGTYGYIEKRVGGRIPAVTTLTVETLVLAPFAVGYVVWSELTQIATFADYGWGHALALAGMGVVTAAPLLLFNAAARRLPLSVLGFVQYLCPVMQFATGVWLFGEPMPPARWFGFAAVWVALVVLSADAVRRSRTNSR